MKAEYDKQMAEYDRAVLELETEQERRQVLGRKTEVEAELEQLDARLAEPAA